MRLDDAVENPHTLLLKEIISRLTKDLRGPRDNGQFGWDLACKAVLWFLVSEGTFSYKDAVEVFGISKKFSLAVQRTFEQTAKKFGKDPLFVSTALLKIRYLKKLQELKGDKL